jgi:hypothetical protein
MIERDKCLHFKAGYKYVITRPFRIKTEIRPPFTRRITRQTVDVNNTAVVIPLVTLEPSGWLTIHAGYAYDGASGPTIDTLDSMAGAAVHDAGYQLIRLGKIEPTWKEYFDELFYEIMVEDGMIRPRAKLWEWAVKTFGRSATRPSAEPKEQVAP